MTQRMFLVTFLLTFLGLEFSNAQMAAARKVIWDVETTAVVPVSRDSVWRLLKDHALVSVLSNGYVVSLKDLDEVMPIDREAIFKSGIKRKESLVTLDSQHRFFGYNYKLESLPKGVKSVMVAVFTKEVDESGTEISWKAKIEGGKEEVEAFKRVLNEEFTHYAAGYKSYLQGKPRVIKAMRMQ